MFARARNICKIVIWAGNDEVISDACSLKMGVMAKMMGYIIGKGAIKNSKKPVSGSTMEEEETNMNSMD